MNRTLIGGGVLSLNRKTVGVFYSPPTHQLGKFDEQKTCQNKRGEL